MIIKNNFFLKIYDYYINYIASNTININKTQLLSFDGRL